ncbi:DUF4166 domain-containing protein [Fulvimonas yonginensis]|uniref:DUF4166 domain-containing protein n=1 Tax=Fulvimonas yonginensis TaxID=1495200 RepID=A0ABU8JB57_9GAMM
MTTPTALFPALLAADWHALAAPVQRVHGAAACMRARGMAEVEGAAHLPARLLRRWLGLPVPGPAQTLEVTIERQGRTETWTRRFATCRMRSQLTGAEDGYLHETLGPVRLHFELRRDGQAIDWRLRGGRLFGLPLPRACFGRVASRSGAEGDRYTFHVETRLPLLGRLVAYRGWLEPVDAR